MSLDNEEDSKGEPAVIVQEDGTFSHEHMWRGSAIALPVFALRSRDSIGAGEFLDLKKLVTLCHQAGKGALCLNALSILAQQRHPALES